MKGERYTINAMNMIHKKNTSKLIEATQDQRLLSQLQLLIYRSQLIYNSSNSENEIYTNFIYDFLIGINVFIYFF